MISKKKWTLGLIVFVLYLLLGASFFHKIESEHEEEERNATRALRNQVLDLLWRHYENETENETLIEFLGILGDYCGGKNLIDVPPDHYDDPEKWDFYHSVFFSFTVVTTVGYGNLAPTKTVSRMFMMFYAIIGIPYNGILFATLGEYFGKTFIKLYRRWKSKNTKEFGKLSLVVQILLYLIPAIIIFIFVPAVFFMIMEDWDYPLAVYYAFVTLTTIGFGDYVAGMNRYNHPYEEFFLFYQICILIWMTIGLGYLVMVIGFLTKGLRHKKVKRLEKAVKRNIKNTHEKILNGFNKDMGYLRRLMNELYMSKFKGRDVRCRFTEISPVYRDEYYCPQSTLKVGPISQSFPDLRVLYAEESPYTLRRRAMSECFGPSPKIQRSSSDTDLSKIDKDATFALANSVQPSEILAKVVDALASEEIEVEEDETDQFQELGVQGFSDSDILKSEKFGSEWSLGQRSATSEKLAVPPKTLRVRAASDVKVPTISYIETNRNDWTWSGPSATKTIEELRAKTKFCRPRVRTNSEDTQSSTRSWLERFRNSFRRKKNIENNKTVSSEVDKTQLDYLDRTLDGRISIFNATEEKYLKQTRHGRSSVYSVPENKVLEETSIADLLRAITSLHSKVSTIPEVPLQPQRKLGNAGLQNIPSSLDIFSPPPNARLNMRRGSINPQMLQRRRFSLHPVSETGYTPPPPYSSNMTQALSQRRGSLMPGLGNSPSGLVHKQVYRLRGTSDSEMPKKTRYDSLRDIRIDKL